MSPAKAFRSLLCLPDFLESEEPGDEDKTVANAMFLKHDGSKAWFRMVLDSAADINLMARDVMEDLGLELKPSDLTFRVPGHIQKPLGQVTTKFYFAGTKGRKVYRETFYVIEDGTFETLVSRDFIWKKGAFKRSKSVVP